MSVISLSLAKQACRVGHDHDNTLIQQRIDSAEAWIEEYLGVKLSSQSVTEDLYGDGFALKPSYGPVTASSQVLDVADGTQTYDHVVVNQREIRRADSNGRPMNVRWPDAEYPRWRVTYTAGYSTVPDPIKEVILDMVQRSYEAAGLGGQALGVAANWRRYANADLLAKLRPFMHKTPQVF